MSTVNGFMKWSNMLGEDIVGGPIPDEITYKGYTTKNLHHSEDARRAFLATIQRAQEGKVHDDSHAILHALKATDTYMKLNDMHLEQGKAPDEAETKKWVAAHQEARKYLNHVGEFMHHQDYWHMHEHELQDELTQYNPETAGAEMADSYEPQGDALNEDSTKADQIDELSRATLDSYNDKAYKDHQDVSAMVHRKYSTPQEKEKYAAIAKKRLQGKLTAMAKLRPNGVQHYSDGTVAKRVKVLAKEELTDKTIRSGDKAKVARVLADMLGVENAESLSPENAINTGLRKIKSKRLTPEFVGVVKKMLTLASDVGIKVDMSLVPKAVTEEAEVDKNSTRNAAGGILRFNDYAKLSKLNQGIVPVEEGEPLEKLKDPTEVGHSLDHQGDDHLRRRKVMYKTEEVSFELDEAADMASLRKQLNKHTELAVKANKAGDDALTKKHQGHINKIKEKMAKLVKEDAIVVYKEHRLPEGMVAVVSEESQYAWKIEGGSGKGKEFGHKNTTVDDHLSAMKHHSAEYRKAMDDKRDADARHHGMKYHKHKDQIERLGTVGEYRKEEVEQIDETAVERTSSKLLNKGYDRGFGGEEPHEEHKHDANYMSGYKLGKEDGGARAKHMSNMKKKRTVAESEDVVTTADTKLDKKGRKIPAHRIVFKDGERDEDRDSVKEEFEDLSDEELEKMANTVDDVDDVIDLYDDDELAIVDDETGEKLEESLEEQQLNEVLSRMERMRARMRFLRTASKRERRLKIVLHRRSDTKTLNKRARRLAINMIKQRMMKKPVSQLTVAEKERVEKMLEKRKALIDRLAMRLTPRVRRIESDRLSHQKTTSKAPAPGM